MPTCTRCGKQVESESEGYYSDERGFLCNSCVNQLDMLPCTSCGRHFPFSDMVEWDGDMFCKADYTRMKAESDEEDKEDAKKAAEEKKRDEEEGMIGGKPSESAEEPEKSEAKEESIFQKISRFLKGRKK